MPVDHTHTLIECKDVSFAYENDPVLKDVSFSVHKGDYLGIVGPNGSGKSTMLRLMLGLLTPQSGSISLYGTDVKDFRYWSRIGYVAQRAASVDAGFPATVQEVVAMGRFSSLGLFRFPGKEDQEKVRHALEQTGMWEYRDRLISDLSGGQQQRVFIARALAGEPEVIVLDEPTVGVDIQTQKQFYDLLRTLNTELDLTLILVSHDIDIVAHEATEIAYINRELIYYGTPEAFTRSSYLDKLCGNQDHHHA